MNNPVKALGDGRIGGMLVVYSSEDDPDKESEFFAPDTDFDVEEGQKVTVYFEHGLDRVVRRQKLGKGTLGLRPEGIHIDAQLSLKNEVGNAIYRMAAANLLGWSSGAAWHLTERIKVGNARKITNWPIVEASLTKSPAEPRARVQVIKCEGLSVADIDRFNQLQLQARARRLYAEYQDLRARRIGASF